MIRQYFVDGLTLMFDAIDAFDAGRKGPRHQLAVRS
jgi:hypothetical protein